MYMYTYPAPQLNTGGGVAFRCRVNVEPIRQSRPDSGIGLSHFQHERLTWAEYPSASMETIEPVAGGFVSSR